MGLVIGMDEAGYGPNLGPLVITVTVWEVPGDPQEAEFWQRLSPVVVRPETKSQSPGCLVVGDSKQVYSPARGIGDLERAVLTILNSCAPSARRFLDLYEILAKPCLKIAEQEPWYQTELPLPVVNPVDGHLNARWTSACEDAGIQLRGLASDLVLTERFNRAVTDFGSKGLALSRLSLGLLRQLWDPDGEEAVLIVADKHGGRNRYDHLLAEVLEDRFILRLEEGTARSRYRVGQTDLSFQTRAEEHFPVAVASMVSKYLRELAMLCFNQFWQRHLPDLKPTKGYPTDARRFRDQIAELQKELGIPDRVLWRER